MYFPGIQAGIQAGHAAVELMVKYPGNEEVLDWATNHKTFIILNGGDHMSLEVLYQELMIKHSTYSLAAFREPGANDCLTSLAVLVPEPVYTLVALLRHDIDVPEDTPAETLLMAKLLNTYGLFR